jgi:hypothetical protein
MSIRLSKREIDRERDREIERERERERESERERERASEGPTIQSFTHDVQGCSGAVGTCK